MRVPTDQKDLETLVKRTRNALAAQALGEQHIGPMSRVAMACYPDFMIALSAELRAGTFPPFIESAVMTLLTNMLLTLADTAAGDDRGRLSECCDAYLSMFINAYADKVSKLCVGTSNTEAPQATQ